MVRSALSGVGLAILFLAWLLLLGWHRSPSSIPLSAVIGVLGAAVVAYALWPQEGHWGRSLVFLGLLLIALALLILRSSSMVNNASGQDAVTLATTFAALIAGAVAIGCLLVGGTAWLLGK